MPAPDRSHALDHVVLVLFENRSAIETSSASPLMARGRSAAFAAGSVSAVGR